VVLVDVSVSEMPTSIDHFLNQLCFLATLTCFPRNPLHFLFFPSPKFFTGHPLNVPLATQDEYHRIDQLMQLWKKLVGESENEQPPDNHCTLYAADNISHGRPNFDTIKIIKMF
jgi:hypothetical protein